MDDRLTARLAELNRKIELAQSQLDELFLRIESVPGLLEALAVHEEMLRKHESGDEDLVGDL